MSKRFRWVPVVLLVAVSAMAASTGAAAAAVTAKSTVTIASGEGSEFTGKITSPKQQCRAGRTVKLYRDDEGGGYGRTALTYLVAGTDKSDRMGIWTINGSFLAGMYYARVLPLLIHVNGMAIRCAGDVSIRQHF